MAFRRRTGAVGSAFPRSFSDSDWETADAATVAATLRGGWRNRDAEEAPIPGCGPQPSGDDRCGHIGHTVNDSHREESVQRTALCAGRNPALAARADSVGVSNPRFCVHCRPEVRPEACSRPGVSVANRCPNLEHRRGLRVR